MVKPSFAYPNAISLIALLLHSLQIIGQILKSVSACLRKLFFPVLSEEKRTWLSKVTALFNRK